MRDLATGIILLWAICASAIFWAVIFESIYRGHFWWPFRGEDWHIFLGVWTASAMYFALWLGWDDEGD